MATVNSTSIRISAAYTQLSGPSFQSSHIQTKSGVGPSHSSQEVEGKFESYLGRQLSSAIVARLMFFFYLPVGVWPADSRGEIQTRFIGVLDVKSAINHH